MHIVIVAPKDQQELVEPFLDEYRKRFLPTSVLIITSNESLDQLSEHMPFLKDKKSDNAFVTAFVCVEGHCKLPTQDPQSFGAMLQEA